MSKNILGIILLAAFFVPGILGSELGCNGKAKSSQVRHAEKEPLSSKRSSFSPRVRVLVRKYKSEAKESAERKVAVDKERAVEQQGMKASDPLRLFPGSDTDPDALAVKEASPEKEALPGKEAEAMDADYTDPEESSAYANAKLLLRFLGSSEGKE